MKRVRIMINGHHIFPSSSTLSSSTRSPLAMASVWEANLKLCAGPHQVRLRTVRSQVFIGRILYGVGFEAEELCVSQGLATTVGFPRRICKWVLGWVWGLGPEGLGYRFEVSQARRLADFKAGRRLRRDADGCLRSTLITSGF